MLRRFTMAAVTALISTPVNAEIVRNDFTVTSDPGIEIAIREIIDRDIPESGTPVLLVHGARVPGRPSFDLPVASGSLASDLAAAGFPTYIIDLRGYGASTRPAAMEQPRSKTTPLVRSGAAVRDISAAVDSMLERTGAEQVSILGWATGGHWAGYYASFNSEKVAKLIFYNTLYGYNPEHPRLGKGSGLSEPDNPVHFNLMRFQNYRFNTAESLLPSWDRSIPVEDKSEWRDPAIAKAYVAAALASDPTSGTRTPPSFRAPSGAMIDSFLLATGAALWDARLIEADTLVIRSGNDFWTRPEDLILLRSHLEARLTGKTMALTIPDATHYVHLDRPMRGRSVFLDAIINLLKK